MNKSLFKFLNIVKELSFNFSKQKFKKKYFENQKNVGIKYSFAVMPPILSSLTISKLLGRGLTYASSKKDGKIYTFSNKLPIVSNSESINVSTCLP